MKRYRREIIITLLCLFIAGCFVSYFFQSIQWEKDEAQIDSQVLLLPSTKALLRIRQADVWSRYMVEKENHLAFFRRYIPSLYLHLFQNIPNKQLLFSFHPEGVVCYLPATPHEARIYRSELAKILNAYPPLKQNRDGIDFYYYADRENRFAGCFYASGFWVSSYNKQLLECVQEQLEYTLSTISTSQKEESKDISNLPSINKLSGSVSLIWYDGYQWMNTDITLLPDCLSFFSVLPISRSADSSEMVMADTFRLRLSNYLHLPMDSLALQYSSDEESLYVTVSIKD